MDKKNIGKVPGYDGFVPFSNGSWISGNLGYDAAENELFTLDGTTPAPEEAYVSAMHLRVQAFVQANNLILKSDYYKP